MRPHSTEWYKRLSTLQVGFYYPWQSHVAPGNGEEAYFALVQEHLAPHVDLLDVACGHGTLTLQFARHCRSVFGYDLIPSYIEMAQAAAREQADREQAAREQADREQADREHAIANAHFLAYDSSIPANDGQARIPAEDNSFDLLVSSKGPFHWVEDARRVARNGATLIMLIPDGIPMPIWHDLLPDPLQWSFGADPNWARTTMEPRLFKSGIPLHSWWSFDVPEYFTEPEQLYAKLTWGKTADEKPPYAEVAAQLAAIFTDFSSPDGLALRHRRYLWKAIVTK